MRLLDIERRKVGRTVKPGEDFQFVFGFGDNWVHCCTVAPLEPQRLPHSKPWALCPPKRCPTGVGAGSEQAAAPGRDFGHVLGKANLPKVREMTFC